MSNSKALSLTLLALSLGATTGLALAQMLPGAASDHGAIRGSPQWQTCKKQADDKRLTRGEERKQFMQKCMQPKDEGKDAAKSQALLDKMRAAQGEHLHSDALPAATPAPESPKR